MQKIRKTNYLKLAFLLILLIIGAVMGPQLLFFAQDRHVQEMVYQGERDSMDMSALNADYPKDIKTRLADFAEGLKEDRHYYAYATDYEINADAYKLADKVLYEQEWSDFLFSFQLFPEPYYSTAFKGYDIKSWKRYVISDESFESGVTLMVWYFDIILDEEMETQLLVDVEDNTLYATRFANADQLYFSNCPFNNLIGYMPPYWIYYYDAENEEKDNYDYYMEMYGIADVAVDNTAQIADSDIREIEKNKILKEKNMETLEKQYLDIVQKGSFTVPLMYGANHLNWETCLIKNELSEKPDLFMGIREIWELIPEFAKQNEYFF